MKCACSRILIFLLKKGQFVSVVGSNGSGKSFYVKHRMRKHHPGQREDTH